MLRKISLIFRFAQSSGEDRSRSTTSCEYFSAQAVGDVGTMTRWECCAWRNTQHLRWKFTHSLGHRRIHFPNKTVFTFTSQWFYSARQHAFSQWTLALCGTGKWQYGMNSITDNAAAFAKNI